MLNPIKWSGSKRHVAKTIVSYFPNGIEHYVEGFCGGCSVLLELLMGNNWNKSHALQSVTCIDTDRNLINLWNVIKSDPQYLAEQYTLHWTEFNSGDIQRRKDYFNVIRGLFGTYSNVNNLTSSDFDIKKSASLFLFLNRTAFNGLVRYNKSGIYNSTCHFSRPGIKPETLSVLLFKVSNVLNIFNVRFKCRSFFEHVDLCNSKNVYYFLDPPYSDSSKKLMYNGRLPITNTELSNYLNTKLKDNNWSLTYDGDRGEDKSDVLFLLNINLVYLQSGNSSYSRMNGKSVEVLEKLYIHES